MHDVTERALERTSLCRNFDLGSDFEFRDDGENGITFEGVASVVDTPYTVRDQFGEFTETIRAGAFNRTLKSKADVALFVNHDTRALPLATRSSGTLQLAADPHLRVVASMNGQRPSVQEVRHAVADRQATQMSIGFNVPKDPKKDVWNADYTERVIHEVNVLETSIVWKGASPTTTGKMRSLDELLELDMSDWSEDEVRRAILHLETRLPTVEDEAAAQALADAAAQIAERDRADRERLDRLRLVRP